MKSQYPTDWPQGLIDIAEIIGPELALVLVQHVGGVPVYVPKQPESSHKLAKFIGLPALRKLSEIYGGDLLDVPKYAAAKSKKVRLRQLLKDGNSFREAALNADATVRYVTMVSKGMKRETQQLSLLNM